MLAMATGAAEWEINSGEANEMAKAIAEINSLYPQKWIDEKTLAWMNLAQCFGIVYGSKIIAYRMRKQMEMQMMRERRMHNPAAAPVEPARASQTVNGQEVPVERKTPSREIRTGEIPGVGSVEFPPGHALSGGLTS